jgi:two-component system sensor histidine kinase QseC
MTSLRRRVSGLLVSAFLVAWGLLTVFTFFSARHEVEELFDAELAQSARVLLNLTLHELSEDDAKELGSPNLQLGPKHSYEEKIAFQIWQRDVLLLRSPNAPGEPVAREPGYSAQIIGGEPWRVFTLVDPALYLRIEVGEQLAVRNELIYEILWQSLLPIVLILPILFLLIRPAVTRALAPMKRVTAELAERSPVKLQPVSVQDVPEEVQPLARTLNDLLARLGAALDSERRFTANAAHELRTPLAGLKSQAQRAQRADSLPERERALQQVLAGVDRATHLVNQLLTLARLDPDAPLAELKPVSLQTLAQETVAELAPLAMQKGIDVGVANAGDARVSGDSGMLQILLRNLVDNAIRYTNAGGRVDVSVLSSGNEAVLCVQDTGPGIVPAERVRVFERFYRMPGTVVEGCGLGLSIANRIAQAHRANIELDAPPGGSGLIVRVRFAHAT